MRAYDQGAHVRVVANSADVARFNASWPCSELRDWDNVVSATFDKRSGDLVDHNVPEEHDGDALVALIEDMQEYARKRGLLS